MRRPSCRQSQENREAAISDVADSLETFYNRTRHHSHLGKELRGEIVRHGVTDDAVVTAYTFADGKAKAVTM